MNLYIKNMVSLRCKVLVKQTLEEEGLHAMVVELGEVEISDRLSLRKRRSLKMILTMANFLSTKQ